MVSKQASDGILDAMAAEIAAAVAAKVLETIRPELEQTLHAPTYYTIKQVADLMSVSPDTITRRINAGCCGPDGVIELGGRRRITEKGLAALEAACRWKFA